MAETVVEGCRTAVAVVWVKPARLVLLTASQLSLSDNSSSGSAKTYRAFLIHTCFETALSDNAGVVLTARAR
jgi:hypothetical protein